jgi:hypothetical protein
MMNRESPCGHGPPPRQDNVFKAIHEGRIRQAWFMTGWLCVLAQTAVGQAPGIAWAFQPTVTGDGSTYVSCDRTTADGFGNVFVAGTFFSVRSLAFGSYTLVNAPPVRIDPSFLVKFSRGGNVLWALATDQRFLFEAVAATRRGNVTSPCAAFR